MTRTRIKICGITRAEDADAAAAAGADAVGVIFAPSPRRVSVSQAAVVLADVPPLVARVGVFVDPTLAEVAEAVHACGLTAVQLSGHESAATCRTLAESTGAAVIKTIHVGAEALAQVVDGYRGSVSALLLDTYSPSVAGGTSRRFDWTEALPLPAWTAVFAAGGLDSANVAACIRVLRPFAVDVSSGVEQAPGVKNHQRIAEFCAAVRDADEHNSPE